MVSGGKIKTIEYLESGVKIKNIEHLESGGKIKNIEYYLQFIWSLEETLKILNIWSLEE